jgi:hypothetical protein
MSLRNRSISPLLSPVLLSLNRGARISWGSRAGHHCARPSLAVAGSRAHGRFVALCLGDGDVDVDLGLGGGSLHPADTVTSNFAEGLGEFRALSLVLDYSSALASPSRWRSNAGPHSLVLMGRYAARSFEFRIPQLLFISPSAGTTTLPP